MCASSYLHISYISIYLPCPYIYCLLSTRGTGLLAFGFWLPAALLYCFMCAVRSAVSPHLRLSRLAGPGIRYAAGCGLTAWSRVTALVQYIHSQKKRMSVLVSVLVLCAQDVLIQRHALGAYHTLALWASTCCTHPHWDEPSVDCAHRHLREESNISGLALAHRGQVTYPADVGSG